MRKLGWKISAAAALLLGGSCSIGLAAPVQLMLGVASPSVRQTAVLPYVWDEDWFAGDAYTYNHGIARIAGALMSNVYLQPQYGELTSLLDSLGCSLDTLEEHHYAAVEPEYPDKSGYSFCTKRIAADGQEVPLVFVVVRGTAGRQEWLSNANVADSTQKRQRYHEGFAASARMIALDLRTYMERQGIDASQARVLVTGHSRGAAVANLLGAFLDRDRLAEADAALGLHLLPKHIYVYTFATPNSCSNLAERSAARYKNIFNIVNPEDIVPQLPFIKGSWGYGSFGTSYCLPTANNLRGDRKRYEQLLEHMQKPFGELTLGRSYTPVPGSEWLARDIKGMQWALVGSVPTFYSNRRMVNHASFCKILNGLAESEDERQEMYYEGMLKVLVKKFPEERAGFEDMHAPQTYNAWMLSGEPKDIFMRGTPSRVRIALQGDSAAESTVRSLRIQAALGKAMPQQPFDLELRVPGGETVLRMKAGTAEPAADSAVYAARNEGKAVSFSVPEDGRLEAVITARQDIQLQVALRLEANRENGVLANADPRDELSLQLKKGQQQVFEVAERNLIER